MRCAIYILWEEEMVAYVQKREDGSPWGSLQERLLGDVYLSTFYSSKEVKRLKRRFSMYIGSFRY
jgi:hypothetical protein